MEFEKGNKVKFKKSITLNNLNRFGIRGNHPEIQNLLNGGVMSVEESDMEGTLLIGSPYIWKTEWFELAGEEVKNEPDAKITD